MRELFYSEWRRFRKAAFIAAGLHLVLLLLANRIMDLLQRRALEYRFLASFYIIAGLVFALFQFGTVRQPSRWMWLMHRPISPPRIFAALAMASAALIVLVVGLPALVVTLGIDVLSARTVDLRHYALVLQLVLVVGAAWLCGSYTILNRSYLAAVILIMPLLLTSQLASAPAMLLASALNLGLLAYIVLGAFKPNRAAPTGHAIALMATALPMQLGFYFVLTLGGSFVWQSSQILLGLDPLNRPVPPAGGYTENNRAESADVLAAGLRTASDPRAQGWLKALAQQKSTAIRWSIESYPVRQQAGNLENPQWTDRKSRTLWTFSHDRMIYEGRDLFTGRAKGIIGLHGTGDATAFPAVPVVRGDTVHTAPRDTPIIVLPHAAYEFDAASGRLLQLLALAPTETLAGEPAVQGGELFAATNARLIAYEKAVAGVPLSEKYSIALPGPFTDLERIDTVRIDGERLFSFSYGSNMNEGSGEAAQLLVLVDANGHATQVARRALTHDFPLLFEHHRWWVSPPIYTLLALPSVLFEEGRVLDAGQARNDDALTRSRPAQAWMAALVSSIAAALAAWAWLRRTGVGPWRRAGWIGACFVFGLPCMLSLAILQARPPPRMPLAQAAPAPA
jgi:hypothetical protein